MYCEWHNKWLNKEKSLFLTILNNFLQIFELFKYFVRIKPGTAMQLMTIVINITQ